MSQRNDSYKERQNSESGVCKDDCHQGGFFRLSQTECGRCAKNCFTCSSSEVSGCSRCMPATLRNEDTNECSVTCKEGYYDDKKGVCRKCHHRCLTCSEGESTDCLSCPQFTSLESKAPSKCSPNEGFFMTKKRRGSNTVTNSALDVRVAEKRTVWSARTN